MSPIATQDDALQNLKKHLDEKKIRMIAVIDDAYDPPLLADFSIAQLESFVAEVNGDDKAYGELATLLDFELVSAENITDDVLQKVWEHAPSTEALQVCRQSLFANYVGKSALIEPLCRTLEDDLGCKVRCFGARDHLDDDSVSIVFIDYYLEPGSDSPNTALRFIENIRKLYGDVKNKPLMVVMSTHNLRSSIEEFRQKTGYIPGMFYFIQKDELSNPKKLLFTLGQFITAIPDAALVQGLVDTLANALDTVSEEFVNDIKELTLSDYAYIQKLSLQEDGHPLGDYMLWLFASHLSHLISTHASVSTKREAIDTLTFKDFPPGQLPPSVMLAKLYRNALATNMDDNMDHPRDIAKTGDKLPFLHLGDLFTSEDKDLVWMVINAQCDLLFTPDNPSRKIKAEQTVLLIPGKLQAITKPISPEELSRPRTELFELGGKTYRILWDTKNVMSKPIGELKKWQRTKNYRRSARLRLAAALAVQQAFASDLTRVGMPVIPPIYQPINVEFACKGEDGNACVIYESPRCMLFLTRSGEHCILDVQTVYELEGIITEAVQMSEKRIATLREKSKDTKSQGEATKELRSCLTKFKNSRLLCDGFKVPASDGKCKLAAYPVHVFRNKVLAGKQYSYDYPLIINIVDAEIPEVNSE